METKQEIKVDLNNMFAENIGLVHGIDRADVDDLAVEANRAHQAISRMKPGFMDLPEGQSEVVQDIKSFAEEKAKAYDNFVVLGIGGSALGNIALQTALNKPYYNLNPNYRGDYPRIFVPDNVDPVRFTSLMESLDLSKTVFNVISKSGSTAETMSQYLLARKAVADELGEEAVKDHFIATTSKDSGFLIEIAGRENFPVFNIPENVGGRFSVLTPVGLISAAFAGIDIEELLAGAAAMAERTAAPELWDNPAYLHGVLQYLAFQQGKSISVMMAYSHLLKDFADWYRQLWAESLGKEVDRSGQKVNTGPTPVNAVGATDQHSQVQLYMEGPYDKVITFLEVENHDVDLEIPKLYQDLDGVNYLGGNKLGDLLNIEKKATELALTERNRLNNTIIFPEVNEYTVGQFIYLLELETAFVGELLNVNAFNQPGVELGKEFTYGILGRKGYKEKGQEFRDRSEPNSDYIL
ncbi:MAG: glucose-6-phosphate isomerase [Bacillota bacterium]